MPDDNPQSIIELNTWLIPFQHQALINGDAARLRLMNLDREAFSIIEEQPQLALALYTDGATLAHALDEPCWELFYQYWQVEMHLTYLHDTTKALNYAIEAVLLASQPRTEQCIIRAAAWLFLASTYIFIDAVGYEDKIIDALDYAEAAPVLERDTWRLIAHRRALLHLDAYQYQPALDAAMVYLQRAMGYDFRSANGYVLLCEIFYAMGDYERLNEAARSGEIFARRADRKIALAILAIWRGVTLYTQGQGDAADSLVQSGLHQLSQLRITHGSHVALCAYYDAIGDVARSAKVRREEIAIYQAQGALLKEAHSRTKLVELLANAGQPHETELREAYDAARKLIKPQIITERLDRIGGRSS